MTYTLKKDDDDICARACHIKKYNKTNKDEFTFFNESV